MLCAISRDTGLEQIALRRVVRRRSAKRWLVPAMLIALAIAVPPVHAGEPEPALAAVTRSEAEDNRTERAAEQGERAASPIVTGAIPSPGAAAKGVPPARSKPVESIDARRGPIEPPDAGQPGSTPSKRTKPDVELIRQKAFSGEKGA